MRVRRFNWERLREFCVQRWPDSLGVTHGVDHWDRVAIFGRMLFVDGVDMEVVMAFAYLHDSERINNDIDENHGERASKLIDAIRYTELNELNDEQISILKRACKLHNKELRTGNLTIDVCFDADRMDLIRVGITPSSNRMATRIGAEIVSNPKYREYYNVIQSNKEYMGHKKMLGAVAGDIIGSVYEFCNTKSVDFDLFCGASNFTDDSVMTLAVAKWLVEDEAHTIHYLIYCMQELGDHHPNAGYGGRFAGWLCEDNPQPYNSWGNGAGMRVSPVGLYAKTLDEALALAALTASVSHNHPEGVKGAQTIAASVFLCKQGKSKQEIKDYVERTFGYNLHRTVAEIRPRYGFDVSCQGSVPEAIIAFLEGNTFEEVIRLAISLGGDSDTIGAMAGSIAACMYPIPDEIAERCDSILTEDLKEIKDKFMEMVETNGKGR